MGIKFPDILEHNNPNYAIVDVNDISGTFWRISGTLDNTNLLALPETKRGLSQVVYSVTDDIAYVYYGTDVTDAEWGDLENWDKLGSMTATFRDVTISTTIARGDVDNVVRVNSTTAKTVTLPNDTTATIEVGKSGVVTRMGTGSVSFLADTGVTINAVGTSIAAQWVAVSWIKTGSNTFEIWGALV